MKVRHVDYYADELLTGTRRLTDPELGIYWRAISLIYSAGGPISFDELASWCSTRRDRCLRVVQRIVTLGKLTMDDRLQISQGRAIRELERSQARLTQAVTNGQKGGRPRSNVGQTSVRPRSNVGQTSVKPRSTDGHTDGDIPSNINDADNPAVIPNYQLPTSNHKAPNGASPTMVSPRHGARLPADWRPDPRDRQYALDKGLDPDEVAESFTDYWHAKAGRDANKLDWHATWRTWCRRQPLTPQGGNGHARRSPVEKLYAGGFRALAAYERRQGGDAPGDEDAVPLLDRRRP